MARTCGSVASEAKDTMRLLTLGVIFALTCLASRGHAQETITLTAPVTPPSLTKWYFDRITETFDKPWTPADETLIVIQFIGDEGRSIMSCVYSPTTTPTAKTVSDAQNKRNFSTAYAGNASTGSRKRTIQHRLEASGLNEAPTICGQAIAGALDGSVP